MQFVAIFFALFVNSAFGVSTAYRRLDHHQPSSTVAVRPHDVEKFRDAVRNDLAAKADELIELIVGDIEKLLAEQQLAHPAFLQNSFKENSKKIIKAGVISITKHLLPIFEHWIADSVKPPVTTPMVYSALVKPIGKSIFNQLYTKFELPMTAVWEIKDQEFDNGFELEDADESD